MAKRKKFKIPKRIAGVKVPRSLRKGGFADFLMSPIGQNLVADVIYHAGAAFTGRTVEAAEQGAGRGGRNARHFADDATDMATHGASRVSHAVSAGIDAFLAALRSSHHHHDDRAPAAADTRLAEELRDGERFPRH
ncbi:MAG TPA: hypothetical protein VFE52_10540 [Devosia sp.]|nr:hypothetical protein [Devosia sp.]